MGTHSQFRKELLICSSLSVFTCLFCHKSLQNSRPACVLPPAPELQERHGGCRSEELHRLVRWSRRSRRRTCLVASGSASLLAPPTALLKCSRQGGEAEACGHSQDAETRGRPLRCPSRRRAGNPRVRTPQGHAGGIRKSRRSGAERRRGREARETAGSCREQRRPQRPGEIR